MAKIRIYDYDICWCYDSANGENSCEHTDCYRHMIHMPQVEEGESHIFTMSCCRGTLDCPYYRKNEVKA